MSNGESNVMRGQEANKSTAQVRERRRGMKQRPQQSVDR